MAGANVFPLRGYGSNTPPGFSYLGNGYAGPTAAQSAAYAQNLLAAAARLKPQPHGDISITTTGLELDTQALWQSGKLNSTDFSQVFLAAISPVVIGLTNAGALRAAVGKSVNTSLRGQLAVYAGARRICSWSERRRRSRCACCQPPSIRRVTITSSRCLRIWLPVGRRFWSARQMPPV
ncbi:hypothetical protein [Erwinia aphidicola]|uniref:hypothetical protein n=1 Tax=Erwinia aphidicola TaxID=68334 RepID=UPI003D21F8D6